MSCKEQTNNCKTTEANVVAKKGAWIKLNRSFILINETKLGDFFHTS